MLTMKTAWLLSQPTGTQHAGPEEAPSCGGGGGDFLPCCRNPEHLSGSWPGDPDCVTVGDLAPHAHMGGVRANISVGTNPA